MQFGIFGVGDIAPDPATGVPRSEAQRIQDTIRVAKAADELGYDGIGIPDHVINLADLVFAVDSVPAIFAITTDTFIVYTSNIMAILGLRALYFALAALVHRFHYLKYALAVVLIFIGLKGFYSYFFGKFDPYLSLAITIGIIVAGIVYSLWKTRGDEAESKA